MKNFKDLIKIADTYGTETRNLAEKREAEIQRNLDENVFTDAVTAIKNALGIGEKEAEELINKEKALNITAPLQDPTGGVGGADAAAKAKADPDAADPRGKSQIPDKEVQIMPNGKTGNFNIDKTKPYIDKDGVRTYGDAPQLATMFPGEQPAGEGGPIASQDPTGGVGGADAAAKAKADAPLQDPTGGVGGADAAKAAAADATAAVKAPLQDPTGGVGGADAAAKAKADAGAGAGPGSYDVDGFGDPYVKQAGGDLAGDGMTDVERQAGAGKVGGDLPGDGMTDVERQAGAGTTGPDGNPTSMPADAPGNSGAAALQDPTGGVGGADAAAKAKADATPKAPAVSANLMKDYNDGGKKAMPAIKDLQTKLAAAGHDPNGIDGKYGPGTFKAVQAFQTANGLKVDGQAGPNVINALAKTAAPKAAPAKPKPVAAATNDGNPTSVPAAPPVPAATKTIATEASMNISMNGTDSAEVAELVDILKNAGVAEPEELAMKNMPTISLGGSGSPLDKGPVGKGSFDDDPLDKEGPMGMGAFDGGPLDDRPRSMMDKPSSGPFDGGPMDDTPGSAMGDKKSCDVCGGMHEEYDAIIAEWDNSPDEEYRDSDYMLNDLAGGINKPKKSFAPVNGGDNPMKLSVKETLQKALRETKKSKKWK
jgi:peptidoglycan hydrolase-like protein with peptidoglycan-binding domain